MTYKPEEIVSYEMCNCGKPYITSNHDTQCDICRRGSGKSVVCAYHGMLISFRMPEREVAAFVKILHDNGALSIEVLPFD